jgi:alpha-mannosidase
MPLRVTRGLRSPCGAVAMAALLVMLLPPLACGKKRVTGAAVGAQGSSNAQLGPGSADQSRQSSGASGPNSVGSSGALRVGPTAPPYVAKNAPDLANTRTLYVVNYAHLDTQWRWAFPLTIEQYLPYTIVKNDQYFERYPSHVFNFTGASRYQMIKEYFPDAYEVVKDWVRKGRWFPAGNQWEECDVMAPSSESIIRQILMGSRFFLEEFGTESQEFMLPDSFGFPASLPSILAHCGLRGFSTQKLVWKSAAGIPFHVGSWKGVDGRGVIAALDPGEYGIPHTEVLSTSKAWVKRLDENGRVSGLKVDYLYNGTGDRGGAPHAVSMRTMEQSLSTAGPVKVVVGPADLMFRHISDAQVPQLPTYQGDLLLTEHSAGSLTSQAFMKRLNRTNELLADAAERASVAAELLGANPYPTQQLQQAWRLTLRSQFHDILPGTSLPKAYEYSWNDEFLAMNEFAYALTDAAAGVSRALDTRVAGVSIVVHNPLSIARTDLVEAVLPAELQGEAAVTALNDAGEPLPTQLIVGADGSRRVLFSATVPGDGFVVFGLRVGQAPSMPTELAVSGNSLSNAHYRVTLDSAGDISELYDIKASRQVLSAPVRLAFLTEWPAENPAWNMDWVDRKQPPRGYVAGEPKVRVIEHGPLRVALQIERESEESRFLQTIRLAAGPAGDRVEFVDHVDWKSSNCSLKATFPLRVGNEKATYSWDLGTIERGNNDPTKYEVPTHGWVDLTDTKGDYGVTLLTGPKYGSDKPANDTLRLTLLYTPAAPDDFREQRYQDWGRHEIVYGLMGHFGDWRSAQAPWQARRLEQPLRAFAVPRHDGKLGKRFSLLTLSSEQVAIQAIKRAEDGKSVVVRLQELYGREARTELRAAATIKTALELNGAEKPIGPLQPEGFVLRLDFLPYQLRTIGLSLDALGIVAAPSSAPLALMYDLDAMSSNTHPEDGNFDGSFASYPAEMLRDRIEVGGVVYELGSRADGRRNALTASGQVFPLPAGYSRLYVLAASASGARAASLRIGDVALPFNVAGWSGFLGQWDNRVFAGTVPEITLSVLNELTGVAPAYLRTDRVAWAASHLHQADGGDRPYSYAYLFSYAFNLPPKATTVTLPTDSKLCIFAISLAKDDNAGVEPLVSSWPELSRDAAFHARFDRIRGSR